MNELIKKLWAIHSCEQRNETTNCREDFADRTDFEEAIQTACKAQRNACLRESDKFKTSLDIKIRDSERESIKNAEIKREDYE